MTENQSLGELLQASKYKFENDKMFAMKVKLEKKNADALKNIDSVSNFFNRAKKNFSNQIIEGNPKIKPVILSSRENGRVYGLLEAWNWNDPRRAIMSEKHMYHPLWLEFKDWCLENGLIPNFEYCHDGGGMDSWFELTVVPKF